MKEQLQAAGTAFQLLTRIPIPVAIPFTPEMLARSVVYYPVVGAVIGGIVAGAGWLLHGAMPAMPAAVILLLIWLALSGGLHMDGLMDTADGVLSYRSREKMLAIMKDSRVGAMGVLAAAAVLLLKFSVLTAMMEAPALEWRFAMPLTMLACAWSRLWIVIAMKGWPLARPDEGMASMFQSVRIRHTAWAIGFQMAMIAVIGLAIPGLANETGPLLLALAGITIAAGTLLSVWLTRKLGGLTGDTYGAMTELIESMLLFSLMVVLV
ncbi:adenosylcobinamide-GDP ribazoletransferase [Paenibacillus montanisoli]|uniref:Adenosylcobinamide-GDP ribazoletransferase n=1 Tax=Paenibacillus montanisoli TaxID=2081970 RepID=A0A328U4X8_9BACL|nr:adenosylcobinamide-GDP ribazoletransferase [Paenibacillus montanisoli]